ncbi:unnamed protein product [Arctogadus glacialis]
MSDQPVHQGEESSQRGEESSQRGEEPCSTGDGHLDAGEEPSVLLHKLKSNISKNVESKVEDILHDVQRFSDNDKLYLYLQLPSGPGPGDKSAGDSSSFSTADQLHTCCWIRSHLEEHSDTCLPKQDVYETYRRYCENLHQRALSAANFGKIIRDIFPNIKARRLGGRGHGIRRKTVLNMPLLPNLDLSSDPAELTELVQTYRAEVTEAACQLICDWAQKILKRSFLTVVEVARFLVHEHLVDPRCAQASLLTAATLTGGPSKPNKVIKKISRETENIPSDAKREKEAESSSSSSKPPPADRPSSSSLDAAPPPGSSSLRTAGGRDLQVEALMKHLPRILPRSSAPDKAPLAVHASPPSLAPKDASGVKVIAMATLPQQQGGAMPLVILPPGCLSYGERDRPPAHNPRPPPHHSAPATPTSVLQRARGGAKRPLEAGPVLGGGANATPVKRKRGRPRKARPDDPPPAPPPAPPPPPLTQHASIITSLSGGVIQKAGSSSQQVVELVIQERPPPRRGVLVHAGLEPPPNPLLLLQGPAPGAPPVAGRTAMVEVIKRAPKPRPQTPPPLIKLEQGEVEITLSP